MTHCLSGKTILAMKIAEDNEAILFSTQESGDIVARADADCCSRTWIEHISLPALGFPAKVLSAENIELNDHLDSSDGQLKHYGFKIVTDKGEIIIDYRNESNGYYGGSLSWPDEYHYGGVYGQNNSNFEWREIEE